MLTNLLRKKIFQPCLAAFLLGAGAVALVPTLAMTANIGAVSDFPAISAHPAQNNAHAEMKNAVSRFLQGMASGDADAVWMFASEEEQDAFGTETAAYEAYADAFPALTRPQAVTFDKFWQEGDTPFVDITLTQGSSAHRATMGFWLDDAGDWKLVSCEVKPATDLVAGL